MACGSCRKSRAAASGVAAVAGTYRVMAKGRKVYETSNKDAAEAVASRFDNATILNPGETE